MFLLKIKFKDQHFVYFLHCLIVSSYNFQLNVDCAMWGGKHAKNDKKTAI